MFVKIDLSEAHHLQIQWASTMALVFLLRSTDFRMMFYKVQESSGLASNMEWLFQEEVFNAHSVNTSESLISLQLKLVYKI